MTSQSSGVSESSNANSSGGSSAATTAAAGATQHATSSSRPDLHNRDFKIVLDVKSSSGSGSSSGGASSNQVTVHLVAPTMQEKQAWISDISQCMDNVHFNDLLHSSLSDTSSVTMPQSIKNDPKLFKDDVDIRFSRTLNSCKVPQIRYATPERLLERLTDLRFLSIDFLNTFLLTYRVFTDGVTVLEALKKVFYSADPPDQPPLGVDTFIPMDVLGPRDSRDDHTSLLHLYDPERRRSSALSAPRRTSGASSVSGYGSEMSDRDRSHSYDSQGYPTRGHWRCSYRKFEEEHSGLAKIREGNAAAVQAAAQATQQAAKLTQQITVSQQSPSPSTPRKSVTLKVEPEDAESATKFLTIPKKIAVSSSSETLTGDTAVSAPTSPGNLSTVTLVASSSEMSVSAQVGDAPPTGAVHASSSSALPAPERAAPCAPREPPPRPKPPPPPARALIYARVERPSVTEYEPDVDEEELDRVASSRSASISTAAAVASSVIQSYYAGRRSMVDSECGGGSVSQRASFQYESPQTSSKAGVVITSFRQSQRSIGHESIWSSTSSAAAAFAIATSASSNPRDHTHPPPPQQTLRQSGRCSVGDAMSLRGSCRDRNRRKESVMSTAATMRVLNVLRHWVSKHAQDFEMDQRLKNMTIEFLDDIIYSPNLLPAEHKAASQLLRLITREEPEHVKIDLNLLLAPPMTPSKESIETLSALEIAEQMTFIDHQIFVSINSEEFLGQAWMKPDKANKAPNILLMTKRFNEVSQLVVSEIVRRQNLVSRIAAIEKWAAVADISRCLHNFNGVLQICAAFTNSSVFRLKKTWEKVSKTTKQSIERLQMIVSSDGRFRNLRDALHRCDPPCIPYLGMYLTDLSFIEEGTPNFTEERLLNFSKMRMIAHVIREIRHFQQTPYKIELITKVTNYLLDPSLLLPDEELYRMSLDIEPRTSRLSSAALAHLPPGHQGPQDRSS